MKKKFMLIFILVFMFSFTSNAYASSTKRLAGETRYDTSASIAQDGWKQSDYAILAYGENYPDALSAAPLAKKYDAPILLTSGNNLPAVTKEALINLQVKNVFIIGGTGVIPPSIDAELQSMKISVTRIAGHDRYDTAIKVAQQLLSPTEIFVVTGENYPDALSIASVAAIKQEPIILVPKDYMPDSLKAYLSANTINKTYVVGATDIINNSVFDQLPNAERIIGGDKYARNINVNLKFDNLFSSKDICVATGEGFADALTGTSYAAKKGMPLVLVNGYPSSSTRIYTVGKLNMVNKTNGIPYVFGGTGVVSDEVIAYLYTSVSAYEFSKMPNVDNDMLNADYWIKKLLDPDKIIMSVEEINNFNQDIIRDISGSVLDLKTYPESLSSAQLRLLIDQPFPEDPSYIEDQLVEPEFWTELKKQINLDSIAETNQVQYGFTVRRSNLKIFPTASVIGDEPGDPGFDLFQNSAVLAAEPLLILHHSADQQWYYVQIDNYTGWISAVNVAISDREPWLEYQNEKNFLVVTANHLKLDANPLAPEISELEFSMGCKLPLVDATDSSAALDMRVAYGNYLIKLPTRNAVGQLEFKIAALPISNDVVEGYMPYTRTNIISQVFKMQGDRYCWGGMLNGRDCSSMVMELYRCFGFRLARDTDKQEISPGKTISFKDHDRAERENLMNQIMPGAVLHFPGHEMLYLGEEDGRHYVISALGSYARYKTGDSELEGVRVRSVAINDLSIMRGNSNQWLDELTTAKQLEKP